MRILLVNKYYYPRGGDCIYTLDLEKLLKSKGNEVAVFSMNSKENILHPNQGYWVSTTEYNKIKIKNLAETIKRPIYSDEVKTKFTKLLKDFNPEIVHLNNIHSQISPLVAEISSNVGIKVVWTLHDYKIICPSYSCQRKSEPCELCINNKINVVRYKCIKRSLIGSFIGYLESIKWPLSKLQQITDRFICPSDFIKQMMLKAGGEESKYKVLHNFIQTNKIENDPSRKENYFCYFGRLSVEKGIVTLLEGMKSIPYSKLKVIGTGPIEKELRKEYSNVSNIEFLGYKKWEDLKEIVKHSLFTIIPSEWYENNPLSVLESFALGTPVLGARIGGLPELIIDNYNGMLFEPGNVEDLVRKIKNLKKVVEEQNLGRNSIEFIKSKYTDEVYYSKISEVYSEVLNAG